MDNDRIFSVLVGAIIVTAVIAIMGMTTILLIERERTDRYVACVDRGGDFELCDLHSRGKSWSAKK